MATAISDIKAWVISKEALIRKYVDDKLADFSTMMHGSQRKGATALASKIDDLNLMLTSTCGTTDVDDNVDIVMVPARNANYLDHIQREKPKVFDYIVSGGKRIMDAPLKSKRAMTLEVARGLPGG